MIRYKAACYGWMVTVAFMVIMGRGVSTLFNNRLRSYGRMETFLNVGLNIDGAIAIEHKGVLDKVRHEF